MDDFAHTMGSRWKHVVVERVIELIIVFIGVYAAFALNNYQTRQDEKQRKHQLLGYLEQQTTNGLPQLRQTTADYDKRMNIFLDALKKGEMPPLEVFGWASGYDENSVGWVLQAGGLQLLDIQTVARLRELDAVIRTNISVMTHYQKLSDELIAPHIGDQNHFYDPAAKQLQPAFQSYPDMLRDGSRFLHTLIEARERLAAQLQAELGRQGQSAR